MENEQASLTVKYFLDNFPVDVLTDQVKPSNKEDELAHFYLSKLMEVFSVFDRLIRYEKYFKEFYPPKDSGISDAEAIEYHFRAYIEDFYILQDRINKITKALINDLQFYNSPDQAEAEEALIHIANQIHLKFKKITDVLRREHVHERSLTELDMVTGRFLSSLTTGEMLLPNGVQLDMNAVKVRHDEVVSTLREKHITQATENSQSLKKMKEWFAARFTFIFATLNGHTIEGLKM